MKAFKLHIEATNSTRRRSALVQAGVAPSEFGNRISGRVHRDRKAMDRRGERKHKAAWV